MPKFLKGEKVYHRRREEFGTFVCHSKTFEGESIVDFPSADFCKVSTSFLSRQKRDFNPYSTKKGNR